MAAVLPGEGLFAGIRLKDSMIAASALAHDLTIATRNVADFKKAGVKLVNPFG